jgi:hypothetical protein
VFYCGLQEWDAESGWNRDHRPGLYVAGYFEIALAGRSGDFENRVLATEFGNNFHVRYPTVFKQQKADLVLVKKDAEQEALKEIEAAPGTPGISDVEALKEYSAQFDRAALRDALKSCGNYKKFAEPLGLLNTGAVQGRQLTKRRADFNRPEWRTALEALYHEVRGLRGRYTELVRSGEINEEKCTRGFRNHTVYDECESRKRAINDQLNAVGCVLR